MTDPPKPMTFIGQESCVKMCVSADGEIMEDNTDYLVLGVVWAVGGSARCTAGRIPKDHLKLLVQVFPEPGRGTICPHVGQYIYGCYETCGSLRQYIFGFRVPSLQRWQPLPSLLLGKAHRRDEAQYYAILLKYSKRNAPKSRRTY